MTRDGRDPQVDLVRRYARILRSAPAEAWRAQRRESLAKASTTRIPLSVPGESRPTAGKGRSVRRRVTPA